MMIDISLPFEWCEDCRQLDIETSTVLALGITPTGITKHQCTHAEYCRACEDARKGSESEND